MRKRFPSILVGTAVSAVVVVLLASDRVRTFWRFLYNCVRRCSPARSGGKGSAYTTVQHTLDCRRVPAVPGSGTPRKDCGLHTQHQRRYRRPGSHRASTRGSGDTRAVRGACKVRTLECATASEEITRAQNEVSRAEADHDASPCGRLALETGVRSASRPDRGTGTRRRHGQGPLGGGAGGSGQVGVISVPAAIGGFPGRSAALCSAI